MNLEKQQDIPLLDMLRGLAAILVVVGHARLLLLPSFRFENASSFDATAQLLIGNHGHSAVLAFFVISGFLVGGAAFREQRRPLGANWTGFALRRLIRLQVVLLPALLVTATLDSVSRALLSGRVFKVEGFAPVAPSITDFIGNVGLVQGVLVPPFGSNAALWSLSWEWASYLSFPLLLVAVSSGAANRRLACFTLASAIIFIMGPRWAVYFVAWCFGAAVAKFRIQNRPAPLSIGLASLILLCAIALARPLARAGWFVLEALSIAVSVSLVIWASRSRSLRPAESAWGKMGAMSYSLYAVHSPILVMIATSGLFDSLKPDCVGWSAVIIATAACVGCAWVFWWCFERHTKLIRGLILGAKE